MTPRGVMKTKERPPGQRDPSEKFIPFDPCPYPLLTSRADRFRQLAAWCRLPEEQIEDGLRKIAAEERAGR